MEIDVQICSQCYEVAGYGFLRCFVYICKEAALLRAVHFPKKGATFSHIFCFVGIMHLGAFEVGGWKFQLENSDLSL